MFSDSDHSDDDNYEYRKFSRKYRARSAYKLKHINERYNLLKGARNVVDLCSAPGSWTQVLVEELITKKFTPDEPPKVEVEAPIIVSVDLIPFRPIEHAIQMQGDITDIETANRIIGLFDGKLADAVFCDGAANLSVSEPMGDYLHDLLYFAAVHIACNILKPSGFFVIKVFRCDMLTSWQRRLLLLFECVDKFKPSSSRRDSPECFLIGRKYSPPDGFDPKLLTKYTNPNYRNYSDLIGPNRIYVPILVEDNYDEFFGCSDSRSGNEHIRQLIELALAPEIKNDAWGALESKILDNTVSVRNVLQEELDYLKARNEEGEINVRTFENIIGQLCNDSFVIDLDVTNNDRGVCDDYEDRPEVKLKAQVNLAKELVSDLRRQLQCSDDDNEVEALEKLDIH